MAFISVSSSTGMVQAVVTRTGKETALKEGKLNIDSFVLMDTEINYQLLNPNNIDEDDPDILAQAVFEPSLNDRSSDYDPTDGVSKGFLLHRPYYFRQQTVLAGNRLIDNSLYAPNVDIVIPMDSLSGDPTNIFPPANSSTGVVVTTNAYYSITVNVGDSNGSVVNNTMITLFQNNALYESRLLNNNTTTVFSNLSANQAYRVLISNPAYSFKALSSSGVHNWNIHSLRNNETVKFTGFPLSPGGSTYTLSGTITNQISAAAVSGLLVKVYYLGTSSATTTNGSGEYVFGGLSANTQYGIAFDSVNYYYDELAVSVTGNLTANAVHNIPVFPRSVISGKVYYNNTTIPISNAVVNLYSSLSSASNSTYITSVASREDGSFTFPNVSLQRDYNVRASLQKYTFVNTPYNITSSSMTASITGVTVYGKKDERPIIYDTPFPLKRGNINNDATEYPVFYDPCSWTLFSSKIGYIGYASQYTYSPVRHDQVVRSTNYNDLIKTLEGPYEFSWASRRKYTDAFGNISSSAYISDNYTIKLTMYVLPYQYSQSESLPQWDEFSKNEKQGTFPLQINGNITDLQLQLNQQLQFFDIVPDLQDQQLSLNVKSFNNLQSSLPKKKVALPFTVNPANSIPELGLLAAQSFTLDPSVLNVTITPFELAQNSDYTTYANIVGTEKRIATQVLVDDIEEIVTESTENAIIDEKKYNIANVPLPIFTIGQQFLQTQSYTNNLRWPFSFAELITIIRSEGILFNKVGQWTVTKDGEYIPEREQAYITISTFGSNRTVDQLLYTQNANHYVINEEFKQLLISYFNIDITDTVTINKLFGNNGLIDWLFYMMLVQYGAYKNAYSLGELNQLMTISQSARYAILIDLITKGNNITEAINNVNIRQFQPSQEALNAVFATNATNNGGVFLSDDQQTVSTQAIRSALITQYSLVTKKMYDFYNSFVVNGVLMGLYGFVTYDYRSPAVIIIRMFGNKTVTNTIKRPVKRATITTQSVIPIVSRVININNGNNYFNLNSGVDKKLKMTLKFDLSKAETIDNFMKMIDYLNENLYTTYLGVEIIDNGQITTGYNGEVVLLTEYVNADETVQNALCKQDKVMWMIPMTIGGIVQARQLTAGDPTTFQGKGFIKLCVVGGRTFIVRIIHLTDSGGANVDIVDTNQILNNDYIAFDVLDVTNASFGYTQDIIRFIQVLELYNYNQMNADLTALQDVLRTTYANIANVSYVGSYGPGYAASTIGPALWTVQGITWDFGKMPINILRELFANGTQNIGQVVKSINDFKVKL